MDREAFIAGLRLDTIRPIDLVSFYRGLPARVPAPSTDDRKAARATIEEQLGRLNAHTLGREFDPRVPVDVDALAASLGDRFDRYGSDDWGSGSPTALDAARAALAEITLALRSIGAVAPDGADWDDDADDESD